MLGFHGDTVTLQVLAQWHVLMPLASMFGRIAKSFGLSFAKWLSVQSGLFFPKGSCF